MSENDIKLTSTQNNINNQENKNNNTSNTLNSISPNQQSLKMEILLFKDEVLKDLKMLKKQISEKFENNMSTFSEKILTYDNKISFLNDKIVEISSKINRNDDRKEDINSLLDFKNKIRDNLLTLDIKINNVDKSMKDNIFRIDNVLSDSVLYPGIIGKTCKFKTFHQLIDYCLSQISQIINYREKNSLDLNSYKKKLESMIQSLQNQKDSIINQNDKSINKKAEELEEKFKSLIALYDERLAGTRAQNAEYIKKMEDNMNKIVNQLSEFENLKGQVFEKIKEEANLVREENEKTQSIFLGYRKEFNLLKEKFTQLSEFIKDVRFRINIGEEVKRREFFHMSNKIDFSKKQNINNIKMNNTPDKNDQYQKIKIKRSSAQFREVNDKGMGVYSDDSKNKDKMNYIYFNGIKKARHNTVDFQENSNFKLTEENEIDYKNKNSDLFNMANNNDKNNNSIFVGNNSLEDSKNSKKIDELSESKENNIESKKELNTNNKIEKENKNDLIEENKYNNINNTPPKNIKLNQKSNNNINNDDKSANKNIKNEDFPYLKNEKFKNNINEDLNGLTNKIKTDSQLSNSKKENIKIFNGLKKEPSLFDKENSVITIKSFYNQLQIKPKNNNNIYNSPKKEQKKENYKINNNINDNYDNNKTINEIESKNNSITYSPQKSPQKIFPRTQSALNGRIKNMNNNLNLKNKIFKNEQELRPTSSAINTNSDRNIKNKKIIIESYDKNQNLESKSYNQKSIEEQKLNNNFNKKNINIINNDPFIVSNYNKFKSHKLRNNLSPNVQVLQHGVQQLYNSNYNNRNNYINFGYMKKSLYNSENNFSKYKNRKNKNSEANEIQSMINNLQSYIRGYDANYMTRIDFKDEKKKISKNSSYYKFKEIVNGNNDMRKFNIKSTKNKRNIIEIGFDYK